MKRNQYESPEIKLVTLNTADIITTSDGDTPPIDWWAW